MTDLFIKAEKFKGTSLIEVLQNCPIFNDGCFTQFTDKKIKEDKQIFLEHGKPMIFGKERDKGLVLNGLKLEVVTIGENGVTEEDILNAARMVWQRNQSVTGYLKSTSEEVTQ